MSKKIIELLNLTKKSIKNGELSDIQKILKEVKELLIIQILGSKLEDLKLTIKNPEIQPAKLDKSDNSLKILEDITTTKHEDDQIFYLLHIAMNSHEYEKSDTEVTNIIKLSKKTEWSAYTNGMEDLQLINSPVISCWIPESKIESVVNPEPNTGTWGELGKNPNSNKVSVMVLPGEFKLYQELRQ
jgi:hypothetical protein